MTFKFTTGETRIKIHRNRTPLSRKTGAIDRRPILDILRDQGTEWAVFCNLP